MTTADFRPTHVVPQDGLPAWEAPDVDRPTLPLDALLPVQLVDRLGDWGRIVCANGWSAWVDARLLLAVPRDPPGASGPLTRTADPRPLLARTEEAVAAYRRAAEDLAGGSTDGESFRRRTRGLRVGVVVDGESVWLYDAEHERWVYCDGARLSTYAAEGGPSVEGRGDGDGAEPSRDARDARDARGAGDARDARDARDAEERGAGGGAGPVRRPEPTRVVGAVAPVPDAEPTAVVPAVPDASDGAGGGVGDAQAVPPEKAVDGAEATQVVLPVRPGGGAGETQVVPPIQAGGGAGATQVVPPVRPGER